MFATLMIAASAAPPARRLEERSAAPPARRLEESSVCDTLATQVCGEGGVSTLYGSVDGEQVCADAGGCTVYGGSIIAQGSSYCNIFCDGGCSNDAIRSFVDTHDAGVMSLVGSAVARWKHKCDNTPLLGVVMNRAEGEDITRYDY